MTAGRPTKYTPELLEKAQEYIDGGWRDVDGSVVPSVVGLALHLGVTRQTLHAWAKEAGKEHFSYMLEFLDNMQENVLVNGGLSNELNPTITKLVLFKHGYSDKIEQDVTSGGEKIAAPTAFILEGVAPDDDGSKD